MLPYKYIVDGKEYINTIDNGGKRNVGDTMTIYYNPSNPNEITQTNSLLIPIIIVVLGIASLVGGIVSAANVGNGLVNVLPKQNKQFIIKK